jgi:hypothetical protein
MLAMTLIRNLRCALSEALDGCTLVFHLEDGDVVEIETFNE